MIHLYVKGQVISLAKLVDENKLRMRMMQKQVISEASIFFNETNKRKTEIWTIRAKSNTASPLLYSLVSRTDSNLQSFFQEARASP